jgi:hypothetical protein
MFVHRFGGYFYFLFDTIPILKLNTNINNKNHSFDIYFLSVFLYESIIIWATITFFGVKNIHKGKFINTPCFSYMGGVKIIGIAKFKVIKLQSSKQINRNQKITVQCLFRRTCSRSYSKEIVFKISPVPISQRSEEPCNI